MCPDWLLVDLLVYNYLIVTSGDLRDTVEHSYNKPEIPVQIICYKQEFVISEQFPMSYCSTWLRSLLCYIKKFVIEEFVIRVLYCTYVLQIQTLLVFLMSRIRIHASTYICICVQ